MSLYKDASLVMIPSAYKDGKLYSIRPTDGSGDFTFSRGSNLAATRVDVNGLIEKGRENLVLYSNNLDQAIWGKAQLSITSGEVGYDGGNNAFKITPNTNNITHYIYKSNTELNVLNTLSVYAKYSGYHAQLRAFNIGSGHAYANFDLQNGTKGTSGGDSIIDSTITGVGNGWYRITLTLNYGSAYSIGLIPIETPTIGEIPAYAGDGTSGVIIQDFQGEAGLVATDYIETGASTAQAGILEDMPRLDYSGSCPALLLEPQRTNVLEQSEYYNAYFTRNNVSLTDNATTSTEGLQNASKLIPDNGTGGNRSVGKTFSGLSGIHTFSVFAKAAEYGYVSLRMRNAPSNFVMFDLSDGSVYNTNSSGNQYVDNSAKVEDYGNGWYRLSASYDPSESETAGTLYPSLSVGITGDETSSFNGDGTSGIYIYGMQFEAGSYPTSYIPTYGSSVTRSADDCVSSNIDGLIGDNQGTLFVQGFGQYRTGADNHLISLSSVAGGNGNDPSLDLHKQHQW